jgi:hypothetical protein
MSIIEGLSHITLTASSAEKVESSVQFYSRFGYKSISHFINSKVPTNEAAQFLPQKEEWLHLFGEPPAQEITLKIVLATNVNEKEPFPDKDWRLEQASAVSVTKNIVVDNSRYFVFK